MRGETSLPLLLRSLEPELRTGAFVFVDLPGTQALPDVEIEASVREPEGLSAVVRREVAEAHGLAYDYVAAWIILRVHSSLDAVGLTATVSAALAAAELSCNVVAGLRHDHLLVPYEDAERALSILRGLVAQAAALASGSGTG